MRISTYEPAAAFIQEEILTGDANNDRAFHRLGLAHRDRSYIGRLGYKSFRLIPPWFQEHLTSRHMNREYHPLRVARMPCHATGDEPPDLNDLFR